MRKTLILISTALPFILMTGFFGTKTDVKPKSSNQLWTELNSEEAKQVIVPIPSLAPLVNRVKSAVLVVTTESTTKLTQHVPPGFEDFFHMFGPNLRSPSEQQRKISGLGSGFIIHPSGLALTNNHVIEGAHKIRIRVGADLREYDAEVIGADPDTDVALLQIKSDRKDWPVIPLGSSDDTRIGDFAMAIGNPLGLENSIAYGPISAKGRRDIRPSGKRGLFDFMQISAAINQGNSGGALLNMSGEVIGINTAISAQGQGIAFAIPIDQVKQILPQLKKFGKATRSGMGVRIENVSPELAKEVGLKYAHGALVRQVMPDSAAQKSGIQPGDIVTEFDGKEVKDSSSLSVEAGLAGVGKSVPIKIYRDNKYVLLTITLEALNQKTPIKQSDLKAIEDLGIKITNSTKPKVPGAQVAEVQPRSMSAMVGIEKGDIITKVNNQKITNAEEFAKLVKKLPQSGIMRILLKRHNATIFVVLQKP